MNNTTYINRRAFTFAELLVIIAIISILVAILYPAVQEARKNQHHYKIGTIVYHKEFGNKATVVGRCHDGRISVRLKQNDVLTEQCWNKEEITKHELH